MSSGYSGGGGGPSPAELQQIQRSQYQDFLQRINLSDPQTNYFSLNEILDPNKIRQLIDLEIGGRLKKINEFKLVRQPSAEIRARNEIDKTRLEQYNTQKNLISELIQQQQDMADKDNRAEKQATIQIYDTQAGQIARQDDKQDLVKLAAILGAITLLG